MCFSTGISEQGDQMSLWKNAQNIAQPILCQNQSINFPKEKSRQNIWATSVFFKKTALNKHLPNRRKFVQSGHPAYLHDNHIYVGRGLASGCRAAEDTKKPPVGSWADGTVTFLRNEL
jgi:hypothetical protein